MPPTRWPTATRPPAGRCSSPASRHWCGARSTRCGPTAGPGCAPPASSPATRARRSAATTASCRPTARCSTSSTSSTGRALNEELGATAVMGSQLAVDVRRPRAYDGVVGVWYGKSPGVDRGRRRDPPRQVRRHRAATAACSRSCGDDPASKSSTLPSPSERVAGRAAHAGAATPARMQDVARPRPPRQSPARAPAGCGSAIKIVTAVADGTGTVDVDPDRIRPVVPEIELDGQRRGRPAHGAHRAAHAVGDGGRGARHRMEMARRYLQANGLNRLVVDAVAPGSASWPPATPARAGAGGAARCSALDRRRPADLGIRILKLDALNPLDAAAVARARPGRRRPCSSSRTSSRYLETLVRDALYGTHRRSRGARQARRRRRGPRAAGRRRHRRSPRRAAPAGARRPGRPPSACSRAVRDRGLSLTIAPEALRTPFFCSGLPPQHRHQGARRRARRRRHRLPRDDHADGRRGRGEIIGITQMGGEGSQWIGIAPFVDDPHLFQNLGDGTYCHSGQLAVQAAIAADVTITFKLLYNAAVAMTGGQDATGLPAGAPGGHASSWPKGVREVIITTEDLGRYRGVKLPARTQGVAPRPHHRGPGAAAGGAGRDGAHPRPAVRGREAPRPQAGPAAHARLAGRDRRAGLRGLRRLRRPVQLPQPADRRAPSSAARPSSTRPAATST